ncbi:MAG: leucine-rich repeat domain-containing protein [Clostridia bacterium]|nr:leucine-rich repeat domain-containing protein [Clostridia bacterium]
MWKKILICMALCVCLLGALSVCAEETVDFSSFVNADGAAVIPSEINGEAVTTIPEKAFMNNTDLKTVIIPSSVTSISAYAFSGCTNLTSVTFSENITTIGINAFSKCTALERLDNMPSALESVAEYSFMSCTALKSVVFGENLKSIGFAAFASCKDLEYVYFPASVENIASSAFVGCASLTAVDLPEKLIRLNSDTFAGCTSLKTIIVRGMETTVSTSAVSSPAEVDIYVPLNSAAYASLTETEGKFHSVLTIETLPALTPLHLPEETPAEETPQV